jgi:ornithine carbamoyltransferase
VVVIFRLSWNLRLPDMKHLLSIEKLERSDIEHLLAAAIPMKRERGRHPHQPLAGQTWALIFSKSSTRTRVSFMVGIHELGGNGIFLNVNDIQLGRGEPVKDTARVLGRMTHGAVIRTYAQSEVEEFARHSGIPTVNALTDEEHPCQILSDLFTIQEKRGPVGGNIVTFVGDGQSNVARSWIFAAARLDFELRIAAPSAFQPDAGLLARAGGRVTAIDNARAAAADADVLYTDVWVSMGKEKESTERLRGLAGYQVNQELLRVAKAGCLVMHCLPAYRGKEIDAATFEAHADTIFDQAENRLHVQKAVLEWMVGS